MTIKENTRIIGLNRYSKRKGILKEIKLLDDERRYYIQFEGDKETIEVKKTDFKEDKSPMSAKSCELPDQPIEMENIYEELEND